MDETSDLFKPARQTYLQTFLFLNATSVLFGVAVSAYVLFYRNYIPQVGIEKPIYLQYGDGPHPYGMISLDSGLISRQPYDISLSLHLPRSSSNLARGNFMLAMALLKPNHKFELSYLQKLGVLEHKSPLASLRGEDIILICRRPALLTYTSRLVSMSSRILSLPLHILGLRPEAETLKIPMGESITFTRGWKNVPDFVLFEIQAGQDIHIYNVEVLFKARFAGLRWFMYNYRVSSFVLFTGLFWILTLIFAALTWIFLSIYAPNYIPLSNRDDNDLIDKLDDLDSDGDPDYPDTSSAFPVHDNPSELKFTPSTKGKVDSDESNVEDSRVKSEVVDRDENEFVAVGQMPLSDPGIRTNLGGNRESTSLWEKTPAPWRTPDDRRKVGFTNYGASN